MPAQGDIMFLNEDMSDVTFMVGESETTYVRLPAHRFILSVASNVFRRMFTAGFVERDSGTVIIRDITPCIFKQTLKFIYTGTLASASVSDCLELLYTSEKYDLPGLTRSCYENLKDITVDKDNFWCFLKIYTMFGPENMEPENVVELSFYLDQNAACLLTLKEFEELEHSVVLRIVRRSSMFVSETSVFSSCLAWARAQCCRQCIAVNTRNMRDVMGDILYAIRLLTIPGLELTEGPLASGFFTPEERHMFRLAITDDLRTMPAPWKPEVLRAKRFSDRRATWKYIDSGPDTNYAVFRRETCVFFALKDLLLTEMGFHMQSDRGQVHVLAEVLDCHKTVKVKCVYKSQNKAEHTMCSFVKPIFFKANTFQLITFNCFKGFMVRRTSVHPRAQLKGQTIFFVYTLTQGCDERQFNFTDQQLQLLSNDQDFGKLLNSVPLMKPYFEQRYTSFISSITADLCL